MSNGAETAGGCAFVALILLGIPYAVFFYSGVSLFYLRHEFEQNGYVYVQCRYLNATGVEWANRDFFSVATRDAYYCPRYKKVGESI